MDLAHQVGLDEVLLLEALREKHAPRDTAYFETYDDLYDYLLIDVEMSGCADISYIKQAILSVQLYMKRAHMMLEPGITQLSIPDPSWTWLSRITWMRLVGR